MDEQPIRKSDTWTVRPNLLDYTEAREAFSWDRARAAAEGLPSGGINIAFETGDGLGPDLKGDAFVAMHGSWNRNTRTGYKIVQVDIDKDGKPTGTYTDFVTGFVLNDDDVWGRPVGVAFDKNGNLFFSEDGSGTIWKVSKQ